MRNSLKIWHLRHITYVLSCMTEAVNEQQQFEAVQRHMDLVKNFLRTVVYPEDALLREEMKQYAHSVEGDLPNAA